MFHIEKDAVGNSKSVVDLERQASLRTAGQNFWIDTYAYVLHSGRRVVPFQVLRQDIEAPGGEWFTRATFASFGESRIAMTMKKIPPYHFESESEKTELMVLALEGYLVFSSRTTSLEIQPEGFDQFVFNGVTYTLASFGYRP